MSRLLSLPLELRDAILELVALSRHPAPRTVADIEAQERKARTQNIFYSTNPNDYAPTALPLLLVNKQLHQETKQLLHRTGDRYELDVKFIHEQCLVPTWTSMPLILHDVGCVRSVFQSIGNYRTGVEMFGRRLSSIWSGDGGPAPYVWMFYSILLEFLQFGPTGHRESHRGDGFTIRTLEVDFIDPEDTSLLAPVPDNPRKLRRVQTLLRRWPLTPEEDGLLRPEWLASNLSGEIRSLLSMGYYHANYGKTLHEKIGHIVFKANGKIVEDFDVGQILADLKFHDTFADLPWNKRLDHWVSWKEDTLRNRESRGLNVVRFNANWKEEAAADAARIYAGLMRYYS